MPTATTGRTYRLGARLAAVDGLLGREEAERVQRLQRALSSVVWMPAGGVPNAVAAPTADAEFVGRLMLGLLCRGWPTLASPLVEGALLRGDRRLVADGAVLDLLCDSNAEKDLYRNELATLFGDAIGWVELQRPLASLVRQDLKGEVGSGRVDFAIELPAEKNPIRLIVEVDGPHHTNAGQATFDKEREKIAGQHGWATRRVRTASGQFDEADLKNLSAYVDEVGKANPFPFSHLTTADSGLEGIDAAATQLLLTPHAVARLQLALARSVMDGLLRLDAEQWTIAVVEREVPCAELAVRDWLTTLRNLCGLYGIPVGLRRVQLLVAEEHLAAFPAHLMSDAGTDAIAVAVERLGDARPGTKVDLAVDVSMGAHPTRRYPTDPIAESGVVAR